MLAWTPGSRLRFASADIENKPGTYGPGDWTHAKITAIAFQFDGGDGMAWALDRTDLEGMRQGAEEFRVLWDAADRIIGHNFRRHDKKLLDGFYASIDVPLLQTKPIIDTYLDMPKMQGLSRSLENLADRWGCPEKKMHLSEYDWERAYDGIPEAVELMRQRCLSDVRINLWLYHELIERNLLQWK